MIHAGSFQQNFFHLCGGSAGSLLGRSIRQLQSDADVALVLFGQEAARKFAANKTRQDSEHQENDDADGQLANQEAAPPDVTVGGSGENAVKPGEKFSQNAARFLLW